MPVLAAALYWIATVIVGGIEKPYFVGFLYGIASVSILTLVFLGWWWLLNRRLGLADRVAGFLLVVGAGALVALFCDPTFGIISLLLAGLPVVLTVCAVWLLASQWLPTRLPAR